MPTLSLLIFLPLLATAIILALPSRFKDAYKYIALAITAIQFLLAGMAYFSFNPTATGMKPEE